MGVTIRNKCKSIDMGYGGFYNLRRNIAGIYSDEFKTLYENWIKPYSEITDEEGNEKLNDLYNRGILTDDDDCVLDFLFASDCSGKITSKTCKKLFDLIKDYDDNILYGYVGRPDCAKFSDFKEIVYICAKNRLTLFWEWGVVMEWVKLKGVVTPGGEPCYECPKCKDKESRHLYGVEFPKPLYKCPVCGTDLEYPIFSK